MMIRNLFVPATPHVLATLVSSTSVGSPTSSVIYSNQPCMDFQWRDKDEETFCPLEV